MKILIVDDHRLFLDGVCHVVEQLDTHIECVPVADAMQALSILDIDSDIELILLDINMPRLDGIGFLDSIQRRGVTVPVVAVSATEEAEQILNVLNHGALGFIPKSHDSEQMLDAIRQVLDGNIYLPAGLNTAIERHRSAPLASADPDSSYNQVGVTRRQREVLKLVANGYSNKDIALTLHLSEATVKSHLYALFQLLHAKSRAECVRNAYKIGLIKPPE